VALANLRYINALNNDNNNNANQTVSQSIFVYYGMKKCRPKAMSATSGYRSNVLVVAFD